MCLAQLEHYLSYFVIFYKCKKQNKPEKNYPTTTYQWQTWQDLTLLYIWVTRRVSYKKQELPTLHEHHSFFGGVHVAHRFYFCVMLLFAFVFVCLSSTCVLCVQCYRCLWIVHSWLLLESSLICIDNTDIYRVHLTTEANRSWIWKKNEIIVWFLPSNL